MELELLKIALAAYILAAGILGLHLVVLHPAPRVIGLSVLLTGFLAHGASIAARSAAGGYVAVTTEYEALSFFAWLTVGVYLVHERQLKEKRVGSVMRRMPSLEALDQLNYRSLACGFPLLTLGIITGALWGKHSWGHFWSWEEREVFSLILWFLYAGLLQARLVAGWRGRRLATVTIIGFAVVFASFVFGHVLFPGKHGGSFD